MATRNISTRLAVEGESQYKAAISSVNAELRNMQSALTMTESQFKNNANSTEALTAKGKALNDLLATQESKVAALKAGLENAQASEQKYAQKKEELTKKIEENCRALEELKSQSGDTSEEQKKLTEENERLNEELQKNEDYLTSAKKAVNNCQTDLNKAETAVNETKDAIEENGRALDEHSGKTKKDQEAINALAAALVASGLKQALREIADTLKDCCDASIEFESAMAGVAKTTDLSDAELKDMGAQLKELSTEIPISATELAGIVETAGQLGIAKEDLVDFATVMANLGVATNMTSEEAATMLARFANVTKMSPDKYEALGSTIVALGNNFATTESEVVTMGQRLAAAGELCGLTEPEIMALATAMSSVGIQAEAGGTAMTQTMTAMEAAVASGGDDLKAFADVAGVTSEEFASMWESRPIEAIQSFIEGLGRLDEQGESATLVLDEMGLSGVRQANMLKSLATASGLLGDAVALANTAWTENTALMKEASTRYETTESKITMFQNSVTNLKVALGDQLTPAIGDLASKGTDIVKWATDFANENEWLAPAITAVATALGVLTAALTTATVVIPLVTKLMTALSASFLATPTGMVAAGIAAVTAAVVVLVETLPSATKEADALRDSMKDCDAAFKDAQTTYEATQANISATAQTAEHYISRLEELEAQESLTAAEQQAYNTLVAEVARLLPDANTAIDETTGRLKDGASALRENVEEWRNMAKAAAESARIEAMTQGLTDAYMALYTAQDNLTLAQAGASESTLAYAAAYKELQEANANLYRTQGDLSSTYYDIEAAQAAADAASQNLIESARGLSREEKQAGRAIVELEDAVTDAQSGIDEYEAKIQTLQEAMSETGESATEIAEGIESASEAMSSASEGAGADMASTFEESISGMSDAATTEMSETEQAITSAEPTITANAENVGTQAAEGLATELGTASDAATQAMNEVNQSVRASSTDAYSAGYSVGASIAQGAKAGVMAYAQQVAAEAAAMVRNAIQAAKNAAASNSPSKKMIQLGRDIDTGLIMGIRELEGKAADTMQKAMDKVMDVQFEIPEIPDHTEVMLNAMSEPSKDDSLISTIKELIKSKKETPPVNVTQNIYAENTSYVGQQREAKRQMKEIAREISR